MSSEVAIQRGSSSLFVYRFQAATMCCYVCVCVCNTIKIHQIVFVFNELIVRELRRSHVIEKTTKISVYSRNEIFRAATTCERCVRERRQAN